MFSMENAKVSGLLLVARDRLVANAGAYKTDAEKLWSSQSIAV